MAAALMCLKITVRYAQLRSQFLKSHLRRLHA